MHVQGVDATNGPRPSNVLPLFFYVPTLVFTAMARASAECLRSSVYAGRRRLNSQCAGCDKPLRPVAKQSRQKAASSVAVGLTAR